MQLNENLICVTVIVGTIAKLADAKDAGIPPPAYSLISVAFRTCHEWDVLTNAAAVTKFVKEQVRESICVVIGRELQ